jgi:hypothetical protein
MTEPENLALAMLREMRGDMKDMRADMTSGFAAVASDLLTLDAQIDKTRKDLSEQIVGLRRAVVEYHSSAIGHVVLISEFEERLRRIEKLLLLDANR